MGQRPNHQQNTTRPPGPHPPIVGLEAAQNRPPPPSDPPPHHHRPPHPPPPPPAQARAAPPERPGAEKPMCLVDVSAVMTYWRWWHNTVPASPPFGGQNEISAYCHSGSCRGREHCARVCRSGKPHLYVYLFGFWRHPHLHPYLLLNISKPSNFNPASAGFFVVTP